MVDSSGFSIARYADWYKAKYGKISVNVCAELHIIQTPRAKICAAAVTTGRANDFPYLRAMIATMPHGSGYVLADAQYGGMENCQAVQDGVRRPIIESESGYEINEFNARVEMLRFLEKRPGTSHKLLRKRNNVECPLVHEGKVRRSGTGRQDEYPDHRVAVHVHLLQHDFRIKVMARRRGRPPHVRRILRLNVWKRLATALECPFETPGGADHGGSARLLHTKRFHDGVACLTDR